MMRNLLRFAALAGLLALGACKDELVVQNPTQPDQKRVLASPEGCRVDDGAATTCVGIRRCTAALSNQWGMAAVHVVRGFLNAVEQLHGPARGHPARGQRQLGRQWLRGRAAARLSDRERNAARRVEPAGQATIRMVSRSVRRRRTFASRRSASSCAALSLGYLATGVRFVGDRSRRRRTCSIRASLAAVPRRDGCGARRAQAGRGCSPHHPAAPGSGGFPLPSIVDSVAHRDDCDRVHQAGAQLRGALPRRRGENPCRTRRGGLERGHRRRTSGHYGGPRQHHQHHHRTVQHLGEPVLRVHDLASDDAVRHRHGGHVRGVCRVDREAAQPTAATTAHSSWSRPTSGSHRAPRAPRSRLISRSRSAPPRPRRARAIS